MAKLHNYYVLCPLIDQKSFLGVSEDSDKEHVLVTLGRNVANKYRLSDQKQIAGWTSKDHITSEVIYDKHQNSYVGVFNNNTIKIWQENMDNLDKAKKHKFPINILKIIHLKSSLLIVFANGNCASLAYALENRNSYEGKSLFKESKKILSTRWFKLQKDNHICYILKCGDTNTYEIVTCPLREQLGDMNKSRLIKDKVSRPDDVYVVGHQIVPEKYHVYILWSDSKLSAYSLIDQSWKSVGTVPWVSTKKSVSLAWMGKNHLIVFGSNIDQDGAIIVAFNISLGVGSCKYPMKMYTENAKLYCFHHRIILESSNHIGMLPYVLETKRSISSLLGSHEVGADEKTVIAEWGDKNKPLYGFTDEVKELLKLGISERSICSQIIPSLIEKGEYKQIHSVLKQLNDIPETVLILLLNYVIKLVNPKDIDITKPDAFDELISVDDDGSSIDVQEQRYKFEMLNYIFHITFSDALLIPNLRSGLSLDNALFLLSYISYLLGSDRVEVVYVNPFTNKSLSSEYESELFDWCILLLDSFYQQYLLTKDNKVTIVMERVKSVIDSLVTQMENIDTIMPVLQKIVNGKKINPNDGQLSYTVELMDI